MNAKKRDLVFFGLFTMTVLVVLYTCTAQQGATVSEGTPETWAGPTPESATAEGGNITELTISGMSQTTHWQGFWGQISGSIALRDASNNTMYNWSVSTMSGNLYACSTTSLNWSELEAGEAGDCDSIVGTDADSCTNTFNDGSKTFTVAGSSIGSVPIVKTFNYTGSGTFDEGILEDDGGSGPWVYAATIYNNVNTFKNGAADFQMIVPVNGTDTITYYFWMELGV